MRLLYLKNNSIDKDYNNCVNNYVDCDKELRTIFLFLFYYINRKDDTSRKLN